MIEARGVATVAIGLVRPHIEKTKPPRGLFVPFPLGRPFGEPESAAFQRRVLLQALSLLERPQGPVILEDFAEDAPSMRDNPGWTPQVVLTDLATPAAGDVAGWVKAIAAELQTVIPHAQAAEHRFGRTTVGLSRLPPEAWAPYAAQFLTGVVPDSPVPGLSPALVVRYIADDMKALYTQAAQAIGPQPSMAQHNGWFWGQTIAADFLRALRTAALASKHTGFNTAGSRFIVPGPFVEKR